jgi:hypothetical protein
MHSKAGLLLGIHRCRDSRVERLYQSTQVQDLQGWTSVTVYTGRLDISLVYTGTGYSRLNICYCLHRKAVLLFGLHRSRIFKVEHLLLFTQEGWISLWCTQVQDLQGWTSVTVYTGRLYSSLVYTGPGSSRLNICYCLHRKARYLFGVHRYRIFKVEHLLLFTQEGCTPLWSTQVQDLQGWYLLLFTQEGWISLWSTQVQDLQGWTSIPFYTGRLNISLVYTSTGSSMLNICYCLHRKDWTFLWCTQVQDLQG